MRWGVCVNRILRGREAASRLAHNQKIVGSSPTQRNQTLEVWQRWIIAPVLKTDGAEGRPRVRIPELPP